MKKRLAFCLLTVLLIFSCKTENNSQKVEFQQKIDEVIEVHDEVMPKMGKLSDLIASLEERIQTVENPEPYEKAMNSLQEAHAFMMEWMRDFAEKFPNALKEPNYTKEEYSHKLSLLKEEEKEVLEMKNKVNKSIKEAEKLLAE